MPPSPARRAVTGARRGSLRAAEEQTGHKYETISHWLQLAAHAEAVSDALTHDLGLACSVGYRATRPPALRRQRRPR